MKTFAFASFGLLFALGCSRGSLPTPRTSVPLIHRASADPCPSPSARPAFNCDSGGNGSPDSCTADSDCIETPGHSDGRCVFNHAGCSCSYDTCASDSDCTTGTLCSCRQAVHYGPNVPNTCLPTDCRSDAECGVGGYCSPSLDPMCGPYIGVTSWHCHTPHDTCINDSDCQKADAGYGSHFCGYSADVGYWTCQFTSCLG